MRRNSSLMQANAGEAVSSMGIGGGWQLAWKWSERESADGKKEGGFKRIYLHQEGVPGSRRGSLVSLPGGEIPEGGEYIQAAALVSQPALYTKDLMGQKLVGPAMVHPSEAATKGPSWRDLFEGGVKQALIVGVGIQFLQQVRVSLYVVKLVNEFFLILLSSEILFCEPSVLLTFSVNLCYFAYPKSSFPLF